MQEYRAAVLEPLPAPPRFGGLFPLAVRVEEDRVVVGTPRSLYVKRALIVGFAIPPLLLLLAVMAIGGLADGPVDLLPIVLVLFGLGALFAIVYSAFSGVLARRTEVVFDRVHRVVRKGKVRVPFQDIEGVRVRRVELPMGVGFTHAIDVWARGVPAITLHERIATNASDRATLVARYCADVVHPGGGVVVENLAPPVGVDPMGIKDNQAALLCYLPFYGVHLVASFYYLATARDRPFVLFAAKQSLTQTAFTLVASIAIGVGLGVPVAILDDGALKTVLTIVLAVALSLLFVANLVAHGIALFRGKNGVAWAIPWLRPITKRWLPPALPASPTK